MFGLFGKKKSEQADKSEETASPAGEREINRLAMLRAQIAAQSTTQAPAEEGAEDEPLTIQTGGTLPPSSKEVIPPTTAAAATDQFVRMPLGVVLQSLPREALSAEVDQLVARPTLLGAEVNLPAPQVINQLSTGSVQFALGTLIPQIPSECLVSEAALVPFRTSPVRLQLSEVFSRIPPQLIAIRPDQIKLPLASADTAEAFELIRAPQSESSPPSESGKTENEDDDEPADLVIQARPSIAKPELVEASVPPPAPAPKEEAVPPSPSVPSIKPVPEHAKKSPAGEISLSKEVPHLVVDAPKASPGRQDMGSQTSFAPVPDAFVFEDIIFRADPGESPESPPLPVAASEPAPLPDVKPVESSASPEKVDEMPPEPEPPPAMLPKAPIPEEVEPESPPQKQSPQVGDIEESASPAEAASPEEVVEKPKIAIPPKRISLDEVILQEVVPAQAEATLAQEDGAQDVSFASVLDAAAAAPTLSGEVPPAAAFVPAVEPAAVPVEAEALVRDDAAPISVVEKMPSQAEEVPEPRVHPLVEEAAQHPEPVATLDQATKALAEAIRLPDKPITPPQEVVPASVSAPVAAPEPACVAVPEKKVEPPVPDKVAFPEKVVASSAPVAVTAPAVQLDELARARRALARWLGDSGSGPLIMADVPAYLNQLPHVKGSALVDGDGLLLASLLPKEVTASAVSGLVGKLFGQVTEMARELGAEEMAQVQVSVGRWVLHITHRRAFYLVVFLGTSNPPASLLRRLDKILMALERQELGS